jgi:hypothetical protein
MTKHCERCGRRVEQAKVLTCNGRQWGRFCFDCHDTLATVALGKWEYGLGAVLYDRRCEDGRGLCHILGRHINIDDPDDRAYKIADGTHTAYERVHPADMDRLFDPAGWQFPIGKKPTYFLTREVGAEDRMDLMNDGGNQ